MVDFIGILGYDLGRSNHEVPVIVTRLHITRPAGSRSLVVYGVPDTFSESDRAKLGDRLSWHDGAYTVTPREDEHFVTPETSDPEHQIGYVLESPTVAEIGPFSLVLDTEPSRPDRISVRIGPAHSKPLPEFPPPAPDLGAYHGRALHQPNTTPN